MTTTTKISTGQLVAGLMDLYAESLGDEELAAVATECAIEELIASHAHGERRRKIEEQAHAHASVWAMRRAA